MTTKIEPTIELDTSTCLQLLRVGEVGRLAVSITDHLDILPINYVVDHGAIVSRTAEGTKLAAAVLGRGVTFEIDGYDAAAGEPLRPHRPIRITGRRFPVVGHEAWGTDRPRTPRAAPE